MNQDTLKPLVYGEGHEKAGEEVTPQAPYFLIFDLKTMEVADYRQISLLADLNVYKATFINTMNAYVDAYCKSVTTIAEACDKTLKALGPNTPVVINYQAAMSLMGRAQASFDQSAQKVAAWDGVGNISFILPYAEVAYLDETMTRVDTQNSKPYVTGILFSAQR